jgi:hypothetical protein
VDVMYCYVGNVRLRLSEYEWIKMHKMESTHKVSLGDLCPRWQSGASSSHPRRF